jgi:thiol-disulfide isomerase/thioredoxin
MPVRRDVLLLGGVGLAAAVAGAVFGPVLLRSRSGAGQLLSASFPDAAGRPHSLSEWLGRPVLFNFWATWCVPCREEVPLLVDFHRKHAANGVQVVGICADQVVKMLEFAGTYKIGYPMLVADAGVFPLLRKIGNELGALPYSIFLDRNGAVAYTKTGAVTEAELERVLASMMG